MAKTNHVKKFRGQRACQHSDEGSWSTCSLNRDAHTELDHEFTQKPLTCGYCHKDINIGDPYKWVAPRAHRAAKGIKKTRHTTCPGWRPSELTSSPHLATIYAAQEAAEDAVSNVGDPETIEDTEGFLEELRGILEETAEGVREAAESYRESAEAIEEGFQHPTFQSEELMEKSEAVDGWADDLAVTDLEEFTDEVVCDDCGLAEDDSVHEDQENDEYHEYHDNAAGLLSDWADAQRDSVLEATGELPL